jgi:2-C-methyl-D-erythritol 4-phosphate cytidylyltransferase
MYTNLGLIFLAAGQSSRYGKKNKLLELYKGIPIFIHSIKTLSTLCKEENIIIVCSQENTEDFSSLIKKYLPNSNYKFTTGGKERYNSVYNGLKKLENKVEFVAIHDTARPMVNTYILDECYKSCLINGNGVAAKRISDTIKRTSTNNQVIETVNRTNLWAIETPQAFTFNEIFTSYAKIIKDNAFITDDAGAMEYTDKEVYLVENPFPNKKITYETDLNDLI